MCVSLGKLYADLFACGFKLTQRKTVNLCHETYQAETLRIVCLQWTEKCSTNSRDVNSNFIDGGVEC